MTNIVAGGVHLVVFYCCSVAVGWGYWVSGSWLLFMYHADICVRSVS